MRKKVDKVAAGRKRVHIDGMRPTIPLLWSAMSAANGMGGCSKPEATPPEPASADKGTETLLQPAGAEEPAVTTELEAALRERRSEREAMVLGQLARRDIKDERVLAALRRVPRHHFVLDAQSPFAYSDRPLPIIGGQTISQPYIVGFMTQAAEIAPSDRCLEIGTGSGYQAAVLSEVCKQTYSLEYLEDVAEFGRSNLAKLGYLRRKVHLRVGDGFAGWPEAAPFDAIIVTAAPARVPQPLLDQLALGGRLVIPVGAAQGQQQLEVWTRVKAGKGDDAFERRALFAVRFVPFLGAAQE